MLLSALLLPIVDHCNNSCARCSQLAPISKPHFMSPESLWLDLKRFSQVAHVDILHLIGGEPLLHPNLMECLRVSYHSHIAEHVCVYTNGKLLRNLDGEFWDSGLFDTIRLSVYANTPPNLAEWVQTMCQRRNISLEVFTNSQFFTVQTAPLLPWATALNFQNCPWRTQCNTLRDGHFYLCAHSPRMAELLLGEPETSQGIPLEGLTEVALQEFYQRAEPLSACKICYNHYEQRPWQEIRDVDAWLADSFHT